MWLVIQCVNMPIDSETSCTYSQRDKESSVKHLPEKLIAIATWWNYHNYGGVLQVTALRRALVSLGYTVEVINYIPSAKRYPVSDNEYRESDFLRTERVIDEARDEKFESFVQEYLAFSIECKAAAAFTSLNEIYDAFIVGSDQIWSPILFDPHYYLDFVTDNRKKIAYAPSLGTTAIRNTFVRDQMRGLLSQFASLSVREHQGAELVKDLIGREVDVTLDPTLLLTHEEWQKLLPHPNDTTIFDKYILCYFLGDNDNAWAHVSAIAEAYSLPVKTIPIFTKDADKGEFLFGTGPSDFYTLIDQATLILTDSYHGVIFSLICSKPFYAFERFSNDDKLTQNSRIHNLLDTLDLADRLIGYADDRRGFYDLDIDFSTSHEIIAKSRDESLRYLVNSLSIDQPLVSVIIPVYNVERYIKRCLDSVSAQSYQNLEIIVVDDGTPDAAGQIADECAKADPRIKVIHKANEGVSVARNVGLDHASGEYVVFVDSDDCAAPDYVEYLLSLIQNTNSDIGISLNYYNYLHTQQIEDDSFEILTKEQALVGIYLFRMSVAVWNKIYKRSFIEDNLLRLIPSLWFGEGMTFNVLAFLHAEQVAVGQRRIYYQQYNTESAVRKFNMASWECGLQALAIQRELMQIQNKEVLRAYNFHRWWSSVSIAREIYKHDETNEYSAELKQHRSYIRKKAFSAFLIPERKWQRKFFLQVSVAPKRTLLSAIKHETQDVIDSAAIDPSTMPWNLPKRLALDGSVNLSSLTSEEKDQIIEQQKNQIEHLEKELASFLGIKRSARLLVGNLKRRLFS